MGGDRLLHLDPPGLRSGHVDLDADEYFLLGVRADRISGKMRGLFLRSQDATFHEGVVLDRLYFLGVGLLRIVLLL